MKHHCHGEVTTQPSQQMRKAVSVDLIAWYENSNGQNFTMLMSKPPAKIERWALRLQQYDFQIKHRPGTGNPADVLSRQPSEKSPETSNIADQYVNFVEQYAVPVAMSITEIVEATKKDVELQDAINNMRLGKWTKHSNLYSVRDELSVTNSGLVLRGTKIIMPRSLRSTTLTLAHKGHHGVVKTKQALRTKVWWPKIDIDANVYVQNCHACQCLGHQDPPPPLKPNVMPSKPWERLHMDFLGPYPTGGNTPCGHRCLLQISRSGDHEVYNYQERHQTIRQNIFHPWMATRSTL